MSLRACSEISTDIAQASLQPRLAALAQLIGQGLFVKSCPAYSPPRVVHLTSVHSALDNRIFRRECRSLAARGYEVTLIAPHGCDEVVDGVRICAVPVPTNRAHRLLRIVPAVYRRARQEDADLYHFHDPELIPAALAFRRRGKRVVYDVHEDYPSTIRYSSWLPAQVRGVVASCFTQVEGFASRRFSALIGANPRITSRISTLNEVTVTIGNYPAIADYPAPPTFEEDRYRSGMLVSFGGVCSRTCTRVIVEALALVPPEIETNLMLGGESSDAMLRELTCMPGWKRVTCLNQIPVPAMLDLLLRANIGFVLFSPAPNHFGVGSNRLFEALAAGLPVITSNFPAWKELINRVGCGIAVDPTDARAIAEAVIHLLTHPAETTAMGRRARSFAEREFNWERESGKLHELYAQLLDLNGGNAELEEPGSRRTTGWPRTGW